MYYGVSRDAGQNLGKRAENMDFRGIDASETTDNGPYESTDEMKESIRVMLEDGEAGAVKMSSYLT